MKRCSLEPRTRKHVWGVGFFHSLEIYLTNTTKKILDAATKSRLEAAKTASKRVIHKTAEAAGALIRNKVDEKIVKPKSRPDVNSRYVEEIVIPTEKRKEILNG